MGVPIATGTPYVFTDSTPNVRAVAGRVSSFVVTSGVWSLYSAYDYGGTKISLDGKTEFGPGTYNFCSTSSCKPFNDATLSVKLVPVSRLNSNMRLLLRFLQDIQ